MPPRCRWRPCPLRLHLLLLLAQVLCKNALPPSPGAQHTTIFRCLLLCRRRQPWWQLARLLLELSLRLPATLRRRRLCLLVRCGIAQAAGRTSLQPGGLLVQLLLKLLVALAIPAIREKAGRIAVSRCRRPAGERCWVASRPPPAAIQAATHGHAELTSGASGLKGKGRGIGGGSRGLRTASGLTTWHPATTAGPWRGGQSISPVWGAVKPVALGPPPASELVRL